MSDLVSLSKDVLKSEVPAYIELFEVDFSTTVTQASGANVIRLTPMTDSTDLSQIKAVEWGGNAYQPFPIQITGIGWSAEGAPARPTVSIANIDKQLGLQFALAYSDAVGARVKYIRTFEPYLGTSISLPPLTFFISKKSAHTKSVITYELRNPLDRDRAYIPRRQMLKNEFPGLGINKHIR